MPDEISVSNHVSERKVGLWLFLAFFFFYFLGLGGHIYTSDGTVMFQVTRSFVSGGKLDVTPLPRWPEFGGKEVADLKTGEKRFYSKFGIGLSLAAIPAYLAGRMVLPFISESEKDMFNVDRNFMLVPDKNGSSRKAIPIGALWYEPDRKHFEEAFLAFAVTWTNPILVAGTLAVIYFILIALGFALGTSLMAAVMVGLCSPMWHYSKEFFSEPLSAFGMVCFFYFSIIESSRSEPGPGWFLSGVSLGVTLLAKVANVVALIPCGVLLVLYLRDLPARRRIRGVVSFSGGVGIFVGIILLYNFFRFGSFMETGYGGEVNQWDTPFLEGIYGLLLSPGRGLLIYNPLIFLSLAGLFSFSRRFPREAVFIVICQLVFLAFYAKWYVWEGGWCWGPRFLIPVLPLTLIPLASLLEHFPTKSVFRLAILFTIIISFIVALNGVIVSYKHYDHWLYTNFQANEERFRAAGSGNALDLMRWDWYYSPILNYWDFPVKDYFLIPRAIQSPGLVLGLYIFALIGLILSSVFLSLNIRASVAGQPHIFFVGRDERLARPHLTRSGGTPDPTKNSV